VKRYEQYVRKARWIVKRFGKYRRKLWNDMENKDAMWNDMDNMEERQVEKWKDMKKWKKPKLNSAKIWKIVKRYGDYGRKASRIVKILG
jgi:hypothetical protein